MVVEDGSWQPPIGGLKDLISSTATARTGAPVSLLHCPRMGPARRLSASASTRETHGEVSLDGLMAVNTYAWPGAIHHGNGAMQSIIDERANDAQRKALVAILQGEGAAPGTVMLQIYRAMCPTFHDPLFKPITMTIDMDGRTAHLNIPGVAETTVEPLKNPVSGAAHRARIDLPMGKEFYLAEVASGTTKATGAVPLAFAKSHAHFAKNTLTSSGLQA